MKKDNKKLSGGQTMETVSEAISFAIAGDTSKAGSLIAILERMRELKKDVGGIICQSRPGKGLESVSKNMTEELETADGLLYDSIGAISSAIGYMVKDGLTAEYGLM